MEISQTVGYETVYLARDTSGSCSSWWFPALVKPNFFMKEVIYVVIYGASSRVSLGSEQAGASLDLSKL